jgi:hypothetical protein
METSPIYRRIVKNFNQYITAAHKTSTEIAKPNVHNTFQGYPSKVEHSADTEDKTRLDRVSCALG